VEPDISPLAKRLAEENNVNWRGLGGSGANGRIVERDVLEYLAKVMAGEEDINPTAEPVPEGMEAWPEEDTAGYLSESSPSIKASDTLTEVVTEMPSVSVGETDVFAFDDEPTSEPSLDLEPDPIMTDDIVTDDIVMNDSEALLADTESSTDAAIDDVASTFGQAQDSSDDVHISEDIFLFDEGETTAEDDGFASFGEVETPMPDVSIGSFEGDIGSGNSGSADNAVGLEGDPESANMDVDFADTSDTTSAASSDAVSFEMDDSALTDDSVVTNGTTAFTDIPSADEVDAQPFEAEASYEADSSSEDLGDLFSQAGDGSDSGAEDSVDDTALFSEDVSSEEMAHDDTLLEPIAAVEPSASDSGADTIESETLTPVPPLPSTGLPLSSFGIVLRRHTDLGAAMDAQLTISHELGHGDEPIAISSLLVRAAAKALQQVDIANGQGVGLALFEQDSVRVAPVTGAHDTSFKDLLERLDSFDADAGAAGLAVADMSELGVDEAVLNLDVPVLALGRILQDSEQASQHSTLTLSGNVPVEAGTQFLTAVADLLASPIRLVL